MVYKGAKMHRTQIYFEETMFEEIKEKSNKLGLSVSAYIREVLEKDLAIESKIAKDIDFSEFAGIWKGKDIDQSTLRKKAWKY